MRAGRGSAMAWTAVLLAVVVDGTRLFYVRGRLQTALDAACEDAAWSAADRRAFSQAGETGFVPDPGPALAAAQQTFRTALGEQQRINFSAAAALAAGGRKPPHPGRTPASRSRRQSPIRPDPRRKQRRGPSRLPVSVPASLVPPS